MIHLAVQGLVRDVAFGLRLVGRERLAATIVLVLAVAVAADATALMPVRRLLWAPLPFPRAEQLVLIWGRSRKPAVDRGPLSPPGLLEVAGRQDPRAPIFGWGNEYLTAVGRLRARSLGEVRAALALLGEGMRGRHAEVHGTGSGYTLAALPLREVLVERRVWKKRKDRKGAVGGEGTVNRGDR